MPRLRELIAGYVDNFFGVRYDPKEEIIVTVGVSEALDIAFRALLDPGDEVIYHEPCYVSYSPTIVMAHGHPVPVTTRAEDGFALKAADLEAAVTDKTKLVVLNFPTNPTGAVEPLEELEAIARVIVERDLLCITDEIYSELRYDLRASDRHVSIASLPGMQERTILMHGFSKAYAMTGLRLGYACAPHAIIEAMMRIHQYSMLCAPVTSQVAAIEAIENGSAAVEEMRQSYEMRRNLLLDGMQAAGLPCCRPGGAFYAFPNISGTGLGSAEFALKLLEEEHVAVVPGNAFGSSGEGFVRCCYATAPDLLEKAIEAIGRFVARHG
jgi:aminotransferase